MEKKKRGRPKGTGKKYLLSESKTKHNKRSSKNFPIDENTEQQEEIGHNEPSVTYGQITKCKKCGLTMKLFVQPPIKEEKLKSILCSKCSE